MPTQPTKNGLLKEAIRLALYASLATAAVSPAALAQQNDDEVEEVVTTGSRITRTTIEESGNLVSMDREDIDATGNLMIADVLRSSPLNTYGSFAERSGNSAQSNATIDLRGLGSDRTLVLINGHRIPGSPNLGGRIGQHQHDSNGRGRAHRDAAGRRIRGVRFRRHCRRGQHHHEEGLRRPDVQCALWRPQPG